MSWIHSIGIKEDTSDAASLAAALDSSSVEASDFEGDWKSASGIVVHVHVSDSKATASSVSKDGETFEGSVKGNTIHWQEPKDASGEIWELGEGGKITDTEGNLWTRTITTSSIPPPIAAMSPLTTVPPVTAAPVPPSTTHKENRFMAWLHSIGLKEDTSDAASLTAALDSKPAEASDFEGDWTSAEGILVHIYISDSKATASVGGTVSGKSFEGSVKGAEIHWREPSAAAGEIWKFGEGRKIIDTEGNVWTRTYARPSSTSPPLAASSTSPLVATESPETTSPEWFVPPSTSSQPKQNGLKTQLKTWIHSKEDKVKTGVAQKENQFMSWLHSIGVKEQESTPAKKHDDIESRWLLPAFGVITMFSAVAFIVSRLQRTQPFESMRTISRTEPVNQRDMDEELMAE
jgi:hypothetical protein